MKTTASDRTQAFMDALQALETDKEASAMTAFFTGDATLERLTHKTYEGEADVETFWQEYLTPFAEIRTEFFNVTEDDDGAVLEWVSEGSLTGGRSIRYRGVSALEFEGDQVKRFRTYYDSAVFVTEGLNS